MLFLGGNRENFLADFDKIHMPCVLVTSDASGLPFPNLSSVSSDDVLAGRTAIEHLISLGHRKIAIIGGPRNFSDITQQRYQGCMEAFRSHGIAFDEELDYESVRFSFRGGYQAAQRLVEKGRNYSAIFAMSDVMAIGAIRALHDAGLRVPQDVSVVGLDGLNIGAYTLPRLATISQDVEELAQRSIRLLQRNIEGKVSAVYETVPVSLEARESAQKLG